MKKKAVCIILALVMCLSMALPVFASNDDIRIIVDGYEVQFVDQGPIMVDERILAPVRGVFTQMGFTPSWNNETRVATLTSDDFVIVIPADAAHFYVNDEVHTPVVAQFMLYDRIMLPLGAIVNAVGAAADFDPATRVATIVTDGAEVGEPPAPVDEPADDENGDDEEPADENGDEEPADDNGDEEPADNGDEDANGEEASEVDAQLLVGSWRSVQTVSGGYHTQWMFNADGTGYFRDFHQGLAGQGAAELFTEIEWEVVGDHIYITWLDIEGWDNSLWLVVFEGDTVSIGGREFVKA